MILAFSSEPDHVLVDTIRDCQSLGVEVSLVPRLFESINGRAVLDHVGGLPLLSLRPTNPRGWEFVVKHGIDRGVALLGLIATSPLMAAIALGVRLSSPGPVLFRQRRVGRDGQEFDAVSLAPCTKHPAQAPSICPRDARPAASRVRIAGPDSAAGCATTPSTSYRS